MAGDNRNNRFFRPRRLLIILVGICLFLLLVSSFSESFSNAVRGAIDAVLMPMQKGMNRAGRAVFSRVEELQELYRVREENEELRRELEELRRANAKLQLGQTELDALREVLALKEQYPDYDSVAAHIIGRNSDNWFRSFLIDKGSEEGIRVNMNVMAGGGLCGIVTSVGDHFATVSTIINDGQYVSAMTTHSVDSFIVAGDLTLYTEASLALQHIPLTADVRPGDTVVTSTISDVYLPGLLIGHVASVQTDPNQLSRTGVLRPVTDFDHMDTVLVITTLKEKGE